MTQHDIDNGRYMRAGMKERNLGLELVRVTEAAAYAASRFMGRGDKIAVDQAAVDAMRSAVDGVDMHGVVVIGEGGPGGWHAPDRAGPARRHRRSGHRRPWRNVPGATGRLLHGEAGRLARRRQSD